MCLCECVYVCVYYVCIMCVCVLNGAIPAQVATASAVVSLSSPPAMSVNWSMCVYAHVCMHVCV